MFRFAREAFILFFLAFLLAFVYDRVFHPPQGLPKLSMDYPVFSFPGVPTYQALLHIGPGDTFLLRLPEAKVIHDSGWAVFLDARPEAEYREGHIPKAKNLPYNAIEQHLDLLVQLPVDTPLVVYCSGTECEASLRLMRNLKAMGYQHVLVFFGGWKEWVDAGYSIERETVP